MNAQTEKDLQDFLNREKMKNGFATVTLNQQPFSSTGFVEPQHQAAMKYAAAPVGTVNYGSGHLFLTFAPSKSTTTADTITIWANGNILTTLLPTELEQLKKVIAELN